MSSRPCNPNLWAGGISSSFRWPDLDTWRCLCGRWFRCTWWTWRETWSAAEARRSNEDQRWEVNQLLCSTTLHPAAKHTKSTFNFRISSGASCGRGAILNFGLSGNLFLVQKFSSKILNLLLKTHFGENFNAKLKFWALIISFVRNLRMFVRIPSNISSVCRKIATSCRA